MHERGVNVTYETVREWCLKFGHLYARRLRSRSPRPGDRWHLDEVFLKINGRLQYLWRAVDQDGEVLDILVQSRRNKPAARILSQAAQGYAVRAASHHHRQTRQLCGGQGRSVALCRTSPGQRVEQPGGEFAPTHPRAGTSNERLQIPWARTGIPVGVRGDWNILPSQPAFTGRRELPRDHGAALYAMARTGSIATCHLIGTTAHRRPIRQYVGILQTCRC